MIQILTSSIRARAKDSSLAIVSLCLMVCTGLPMGCATICNIQTGGQYICTDNFVCTKLDNCSLDQTTKYCCAIGKKIDAVWRYPYDALYENIEGQTIVEFRIGRNGELISTHIDNTSGSTLLDDATVRAIVDAAPFEQIPACAKTEEVLIRGKFVYKIHNVRLK